MFVLRHSSLRYVLLASLVLGCGENVATAQEEDSAGIFISVPNPLSGTAVESIKKRIELVRNQPNAKLATVVFDFNPDGTDVSTRDYGVCDSLATYIANDLRRLHNIRTIAFVHQKVTGHTVLAALACSDLVMSEDGKIGEVIEQNAPLPPQHHIEFYRTLAGREREAMVLKMLDKNIEVVAGVDGGQTIYVDIAKAGKPPFENVQVPQKNREQPILPRGNVQLYTQKQALQFKAATATAETKQDIVQQFRVREIIADPLGGETPKACRIDLVGPINPAMVARLRDFFKEIRSGKRAKNLVFFHFDCGGGDVDSAREAAEMIAKLSREDGKPIHTVAYVPDKANDLAIYLAFACKQIVMYRDKDLDAKQQIDQSQPFEAVLGDFENFLTAKKGMDNANTARIVEQQLLELARERSFPELVVRGLVDPNVSIVLARNTAGATQLMSEDEIAAANKRAGKEEWAKLKVIKQRGKLLKLTATRAKDLHIISDTTDNKDIREVYRMFGLEEKDVQLMTDSWMNVLAHFLDRIEMKILLVLVGFLALILEIKMPGATIPGLIALLCFVLFFWAQAYLNGQIVLYAILLFVVGLILVGVEIFILPGFGVAGIAGIIMILGGVALATLEKLPTTGEERETFVIRIVQYGLAIIASTILAVIVGRYLPKIPYANRLMLVPPTDQPNADSDTPLLPGAEQAASLLGHVGVATSMLRPAGMAKFGDRFVDVVTEGDYIEPGTSVQVVEVEGTRIVVKRV